MKLYPSLTQQFLNIHTSTSDSFFEGFFFFGPPGLSACFLSSFHSSEFVRVSGERNVSQANTFALLIGNLGIVGGGCFFSKEGVVVGKKTSFGGVTLVDKKVFDGESFSFFLGEGLRLVLED